MNQLSGNTLAYLGDSVFELAVREYLISKGVTRVDDLHKQAIVFTSATGQMNAYDLLESNLTEKEMNIFKRGRNGESTRKPKNASLATYQKATGFEALIGYLYLENEQERLQELLQIIFEHTTK
ncbi:MAG: Mini-ribonuclease 3 [Bacilli bacterium]|nr:Mini-ribonuclease 3 [Bacilli bacterium]